jgi:transcriptional regulator with XRE-family HTH domain
VETTLKRLGARLRTARVRRNLSADDLAAKIGTGRRAVLDAEKGKPSTSVAVYVAMLWALDLMREFDAVADPARDLVGQRLAAADERKRPRARTNELDNDF